MGQNNIREILSNHPIIPVVKIDSIEDVIPCIKKLISKGINCIEITLRTDCAVKAIRMAKHHYGNKFSVGAGTVINKNQIDEVIEAGADFIVLPGLFPELKVKLDQCNTPFLPGVMTASEIMQAMDYGWDTFKLFPVNLVGGLTGIKTFATVFPSLKFCPTGGINKDNFNDYLSNNSVISVGGSWVLKD